jgi:hypothetical protein
MHYSVVHMAGKSEVYSWRVSPALKRELEEAAHDARESLADVLERAARELLASRRRALDADDREQVRLRAAVAKTLGTIAGGDRRRSERARDAVLARLRARAR